MPNKSSKSYKNTRMYKVMKLGIFLAFISVSLLFCVLFKIDKIAFLSVLFLIIGIYYFIDKYFFDKSSEKFIEENLLISKNMLLDSKEFAIMIVKDEKLIWANDYAYDEFPVLLSNRFIESINLDQADLENIFEYNNNIYKYTLKEDVYSIQNITKLVRNNRNLSEYKPNIAIFQIDNYNYLADTLDEASFIKLISDIKTAYNNWFFDNGIYYQTIFKDKIQLLIPTSKMEQMINSKFIELNEIAREFQKRDLPITYSLGLATNQGSLQETGKKANEALELANTRGGAQTVIFDQDRRLFIGGGSSVIKVNVRIKARVISNTLINVLKKRDVVYIMSHKNPDSDAIASLLLMREFIQKHIPNIKVRVLVDEKISKNMLIEFENIIGDDYYTNTAIDKTMRNIVIIVDTQSNDIISHPKLLEEISDKLIFDHHQTPSNFIERTIFNWIEPASSSTTELLIEMFASKDDKVSTKDLANLCLHAILTDSNNLKYSTSQHTLEAMSILVGCGGNVEIAREKQYLSFDKFQKLNYLLTKVTRINDIIVSEVEDEEDQILLSMAVNEALEIRNIIATIIFSLREDGKYYVKMRSNHEINSKLFLEEFGGGGHARQGAGIVTKAQKELILEKIKTLGKGE